VKTILTIWSGSDSPLDVHLEAEALCYMLILECTALLEWHMWKIS
jgi:hypothetical protein